MLFLILVIQESRKPLGALPVILTQNHLKKHHNYEKN